MRAISVLMIGLLLLPVSVWAQAPAKSSAVTPAYITRAVNDPARKADKVDDIRRQMVAVMKFTEVKPGQKVLELVPGEGYWTRVFSQIVGAKGHVYTVWPDEFMKFATKSFSQWQSLTATPHYANVSLLREPGGQPSAPKPVDLVFTCQNYHDYHNFLSHAQVIAFDKKIYAALKPGGLFVVIDHVAPAGSGVSDTNTLHRIDPAVVKKEVEAAGFVFDGSSNVLRNPRDPHTITVFNPAIRGHTDQFIYRFRKPKK